MLHKTDGRIILKAETCDKLRDHVASIIKWAQSRGESPPDFHLDCNKEPVITQINISKWIPSHVKEIYGKYPSCSGPNCFNSALMGLALDKPRHVGALEWHHYLTNNCKLRNRSEGFKPGDTVAIRRKIDPLRYEEVHGFTIINDALGCSKNGMTQSSACFLQPTALVRKAYKVPDDPNCINPASIPPAQCQIFMNYYNCQSAKTVPDSIQRRFDTQLAACVMNGNFEDYSKLLIQLSILGDVSSEIYDSYEQQLDHIKEARDKVRTQSQSSTIPPQKEVPRR